MGLVDPAATSAMAKPSDFMKAAKHACKVTMNTVETKYPNVRKNDLPYVCMDLVYQYALLVNGFGEIRSMILEGTSNFMKLDSDLCRCFFTEQA